MCQNAPPVNPSFEIRKITKRYLSKPTIPIITYFHSVMQRTTSRTPGGCPPDHNTICFILLIKTYLSPSIFDIVLAVGDQGSFSQCASKSLFQTWRQSIIPSQNHTLLHIGHDAAMRPDGEDAGRLVESDEAPAADSIVYSLSRAVNWGSWRPQPQAAPIAALAAPTSAPGGTAPAATETPQ